MTEKKETECRIEEDGAEIKKVSYTGTLAEIEVHPNYMFKLLFEDGVFIIVNDAHLYGWKKGADYEIRVEINMKNYTSRIFQVNRNTSIV